MRHLQFHNAAVQGGDLSCSFEGGVALHGQVRDLLCKDCRLAIRCFGDLVEG